MFRDRLEQIRERVGGIEALSLVAKDGIAVESVPEHPEVEIDILAAEFMAQVNAISQNHQELDVGRVRHLSVTTERMTIMVRAVASDYYLLAVLGPDCHLGRARYELRRAVLTFEEDLI